MKTIAALATAPGEGGIAIVRISGDDALEILKKVFISKRPLKPRYATYGFVADKYKNAVDEAIAIYMPSPYSYTREDVAEIQCHGGRHVARRVLERVCEEGAEIAGPGEFTKRAFLNGRIDLAQAEAVMSIIKAESDCALRSAERQLAGGMSKAVQSIADGLVHTLAHIEAVCDFPEEVDENIESQEVMKGLEEAVLAIDRATDHKRASITVNGATVAIVGRPNTGKSSLMNAMSGFERAIVSPVAGTTRDAVTARIEAGGVLINLIDTAGQRDTDDGIEKIGVSIARQTEKTADIVLAVLDGSENLQKEDKDILARADERYIIAVNKMDVYADKPAFDVMKALDGIKVAGVVFTSAIGQNGADEIMSRVLELCQPENQQSDILTLKRHEDLAIKAKHCLESAIESLKAGYALDLCAVDVLEALQSILSIRGIDASEEVIDAIFSDFCVGK